MNDCEYCHEPFKSVGEIPVGFENASVYVDCMEFNYCPVCGRKQGEYEK